MKRPTTLAVLTQAVFSIAVCTYFQSAVAAGNSHQHTHRMQEQEKVAENIYKAYFPNLEIAHKAAVTFHGQLLEVNYEGGYMIFELTPQEMSQLRQFGFKLKPATEFKEFRKKFLTDVQNEMQRRRNGRSGLVEEKTSSNTAITNQRTFITEVSPASRSITNIPTTTSSAPTGLGTTTPITTFSTEAVVATEYPTIPGFSCYETVEETYRQAEAFTTNKPNLATWIDVGDSWEKTAGMGGYDIKVLKLTNSAITGNKPKLFVNSAIHAREYTTAPMNLEFARWLVNGYGVNADATWIMDHHEVHLMLHSNPDGRKQAETGLSWRKNTNQAYCGATSNTRGVDLNRNFGFSFNVTGGQGSSNNQCDITYRGPSGSSEPETQAIESYVRSLWPDQRGLNQSDAAPRTTSGIHIDLHSYAQLILWPWGSTSNLAGNATDLQTLGRKLAYFNNYTPKQSIGLYPTDGTTDSVSYGELGVAFFTIEMGTSFFQTCSTYESTIKPKNLDALIYAAKVVRTPYITPSGPDISALSLSSNAATTGVQIGTNVTLTGTATDTRYSNLNGTQSTQNIASAEYYVDNPPWATGASGIALSASDRRFSSKTEGITGVINTAGLSIGKHIIYVRSKDSSGNWGPFSAVFLKINS